MHRNYIPQNTADSTWENNNGVNLAPRARLEALAFERAEHGQFADDKEETNNSYENFFRALGAGLINKKASTGFDSSCHKKTMLQSKNTQESATNTKVTSASKLRELLRRPLNPTQEDRINKYRNIRDCVEQQAEKNATVTQDVVEKQQNHSTSFRSMVEADKEFEDLMAMLRTPDKNSCIGHSNVGPYRSSQVTPQHLNDFILHSNCAKDYTDNKAQVNHNVPKQSYHRDHLVLKKSLSAPSQSNSNPTRPLKSILLVPRYSSQNLFSNKLDCDAVMPSLMRSSSSVQFTAPKVHLIDRNRQNSGWYTTDDEKRMKRKYIRAMQKKILKEKQRDKNKQM